MVHSWERDGGKGGQPPPAPPLDTCHRRVGRVGIGENLEDNQKRRDCECARPAGLDESVKISSSPDSLPEAFDQLLPPSSTHWIFYEDLRPHHLMTIQDAL